MVDFEVPPLEALALDALLADVPSIEDLLRDIPSPPLEEFEAPAVATPLEEAPFTWAKNSQHASQSRTTTRQQSHRGRRSQRPPNRKSRFRRKRYRPP